MALLDCKSITSPDGTILTGDAGDKSSFIHFCN